MWVLGCGISIVQGKNELDEEVFSILKKVGRDSLPKHRDLIFQAMVDKKIYGDEWENSKGIGRLLNIPTETAKRYCEELMMVHLLERKKQGEDDCSEDGKWGKTTPYLWQLSEGCLDLMQGSEVYPLETPIDPLEVPKDYDESFDFR